MEVYLVALLVVAQCVFVHGGPSKDRISALPGQPNVPFAQYSGYITINTETGNRFFYYFVEANEAPDSKPLTLWLNGGPGCSSVGLGAFTELGPFRPTANSSKLIYNPCSWNKASNMLFLDSPAGVGWSYSNSSTDLIRTDELTARDNFMFLLNWFEVFPEYKGRKFYITGESYAGHYAPHLASLLVDYNAEKGTSVINFVGMAIGNPLLNGIVDHSARVFYLWTHGMISDSTYNSVMDNCNFSELVEQTEDCKAAKAELERQVTTCIDPYDVLGDVCIKLEKQQRPHRVFAHRYGHLDVCLGEEIVEYMNQPDVQHAFHANVTKLPYKWFYCDEGVLQYDLKSVEDLSMLPVLAHVLKHGASVLVYSGDADSLIPFIGTRKLMNELAKMLNLSTIVPYSAWFDRGQVGGWTQVYGPLKLTYTTVRGASHLVPFTHPERGLSLFATFVSGHPLPLSSATSLQIATE